MSDLIFQLNRMESILVIPRDSLICGICDNIVESPYECMNCKNLFCKECIKAYLDTKEKYRRIYACPICRNKKNNFHENSQLNDLIKDAKKTNKKICQKCKCVINNEKYRAHINKCWYKCKSCHQIFLNEDTFLGHYSKNEDCKNNAANKFNLKDFLSTEKKRFSEVGFGKIKREVFENNLPRKDDQEEENDFILIDNNGYNIHYDLFFCGKNNGINCDCCKKKTCSPEGEICPDCMKRNQNFHNLKNYYLINKKGKACKYIHGSFHCFSKYEIIKKDKVGNYFKVQQKCCNKYTCEACKYITNLMNHYLPVNIIKKLIKRDMESRSIIV